MKSISFPFLQETECGLVAELLEGVLHPARRGFDGESGSCPGLWTRKLSIELVHDKVLS